MTAEPGFHDLGEPAPNRVSLPRAPNGAALRHTDFREAPFPCIASGVNPLLLSAGWR